MTNGTETVVKTKMGKTGKEDIAFDKMGTESANLFPFPKYGKYFFAKNLQLEKLYDIFVQKQEQIHTAF